jgi:GTPase SAR1 family protein
MIYVPLLSMPFGPFTVTTPKSSTIGFDFLTVQKEAEDGTLVTFQLWELGTSDRFLVVPPAFLRAKYAFLYCYDISRKSTLEYLENCIKIASNHTPDAMGILIGCKSDLEARDVTSDEAKEFAEKHGLVHFECSSKMAIGFPEIFALLTAKCLELQKQRDSNNTNSATIQLQPATVDDNYGWPCQC